MLATQPIGIFDSGIGGLTVANTLSKHLPHEQFIYFGDTLHMPYGDKSAAEIQAYSKRIIEFLISKKVKLIVIACNSASSFAASYLRSLFWTQVEIIGVIRPVIQSIIAQKIKHLGIIATNATIQSNIYPMLFKEYEYDIDIFQLPTPLLAPLIEQGKGNTVLMQNALQQYLSHNEFNNKEAILLACTHYPLIHQQVFEYFNETKKILDNALPLVHRVKKYLEVNDISSSIRIAENEFYVSKYSSAFEKTTQYFYNHKVIIQEIKI